MAQVCQMCGESRIDDDLERCPVCHQSLMVSEGLPPGRGKLRPPTQAVPGPKPVLEPPEGSPPVREKRKKRRPAEPDPSASPVERPHVPLAESSEFGRLLERYVGDGRKHDDDAAPAREKPGHQFDEPDAGPVHPPRARPDSIRRPTGLEGRAAAAQPAAHDSSSRPGLRPGPKPPPVLADEHDDDREFDSSGHRIEMTEAPRGLDIKKLNIPTRSYEVELFSAPNQWVPLFRLIGMDKSPVFGRSHQMLDQGMETMAARHVRFKNTVGGVEVEALDSLNGIYLQITRPVVLTDGTRFRIGDYVLEYRDPEPAAAIAPRVNDDGERFVAQDLEPLAFLDFVRPDDMPGVRFPILKPTSTVLGRGGTDPNGAPRQVDVPLLGDKLVSGRHAEIRRVNDQFVLEDLKSKNGTFVQIQQKAMVGDGATICLGKVYLRLVLIK
jgi:FHA domain